MVKNCLLFYGALFAACLSCPVYSSVSINEEGAKMANQKECTVRFRITKTVDEESGEHALHPADIEVSGNADDDAQRTAIEQWNDQMTRYGLITV